MRKFAATLAVACALCLVAKFSLAADKDKSDSKSEKITGQLIDQACGKNMLKKDDPEASAAKHSRSCATKESCAESGYAVIHGKHMYKFDEKGNEKAKEYLKNAKDDKAQKVTVEGTKKGDDEIEVTSITAAEEK